MKVWVRCIASVQSGTENLHLRQRKSVSPTRCQEGRTHPPLSVLDPLQHSLRQGHQHPVSVNLRNVVMVWLSMIEKSLRHQALQNPVPVRKTVHMLGHPMSSLNTSLKEEVNQVKIAPRMIIPIIPTLHMKGNSGRRRIGAWILVSGIPGSVIGSQGLARKDTMLEGTTSKVRVVLEGHVG